MNKFSALKFQALFKPFTQWCVPFTPPNMPTREKRYGGTWKAALGSESGLQEQKRPVEPEGSRSRAGSQSSGWSTHWSPDSSWLVHLRKASTCVWLRPIRVDPGKVGEAQDILQVTAQTPRKRQTGPGIRREPSVHRRASKPSPTRFLKQLQTHRKTVCFYSCRAEPGPPKNHVPGMSAISKAGTSSQVQVKAKPSLHDLPVTWAGSPPRQLGMHPLFIDEKSQQRN